MLLPHQHVVSALGFIVFINLLQFFSSAPLSQSALPSQCHPPGIHWFKGAPQLYSDSWQVLDAVDRKKNQGLAGSDRLTTQSWQDRRSYCCSWWHGSKNQPLDPKKRLSLLSCTVSMCWISLFCSIIISKSSLVLAFLRHTHSLRNISKLRPILSDTQLEMIVHALICSTIVDEM